MGKHNPDRVGLPQGNRLGLIKHITNVGQLRLNIRTDLDLIIGHLHAGHTEDQTDQRNPKIEQKTAAKEKMTPGMPDKIRFHIPYPASCGSLSRTRV